MIRVLLVDDSPSVRAVLKRFFRKTRDIEVVGEAADGAEAVQAVIDLQPHVVVMDLQMPVLDGYQATERIMEVRPTPIVVLSSRANRNQMQTAFEAMRRGALEVLPKPEDTPRWQQIAESLPETVRTVSGARTVRHVRRPVRTAPIPTSAGGFRKVRGAAFGPSKRGAAAPHLIGATGPGSVSAGVLILEQT